MKKSIFALVFLLEVIGASAQTGNSNVLDSPKDNMTVIDFFQVNCIEKIWDIKWKSISEIDLCTYVLEYSKDQVNWTAYESIEGTAHSSGVYTYGTFYKRTSDTLTYFRLKYSCTSTIEFYKNPVTNICPDYIPEGPVTDPNFIIEYDNAEAAIAIKNNSNSSSKSTIAVYSAVGQLLYNAELVVNSNSGKINIPLSNHNNEVLIVKVSSGNKFATRKIVIP